MSINKQQSNNKDKDREEEDEVNRPYQRRRVDQAINEEPEEQLDVPTVIDFDGNLEQLLNPDGT